MVAVVGAAPDAANFRDKWAVATERAQAVAQYIRHELVGTGVDVVSWGTSDAIAWSKELASSNRQVHILLSVLRKKTDP
jgi:flagellar motor protein MotB